MGRLRFLTLAVAMFVSEHARAQNHSSTDPSLGGGGSSSLGSAGGGGSGGNLTLNDQVSATDQQYNTQILALQQQLVQDQAALNQCPITQQQALNSTNAQAAQDAAQLAAQQGQQDGNAINQALNGTNGQGGLIPTLGNVLNSIGGSGGQQRKLTALEMNRVKADASDFNAQVATALANQNVDPNLLATEGLNMSSTSGVSGNFAAIKAACADSDFQAFASGYPPEQLLQAPTSGGNGQQQYNPFGYNNPAYGASSHGGSDATIEGITLAQKQCIQSARLMVQNMGQRYENAQRNAIGTQSPASVLGQALLGIGAAAATAAIPAAINAAANNAAQASNAAQYAAQNANAALDEQTCAQAAQAKIDADNAQMAQLKSGLGSSLLNASLQAAAAARLNQNAANVAPIVTPGLGASPGPITLVPPQTLAAANGSNGSPAPAAGAPGAPAAAQPPAPAGGGGTDYTFPNGSATAGPNIPPLNGEASYEIAGGGAAGGVGGFGESGFTGDPYANTAALNDPSRAVASVGEVQALGDGGINILLNKTRIRMASHAQELVLAYDIDKLSAAPLRTQ